MSIKELKERANQAFTREQHWEPILSDAYDYFLPNRNLFDRVDTGQKKMDLIFDSTAGIAIQDGASKLQENLCPIWSRWAIFELTEDIKRQAVQSGGDIDEDEIRANLEQQTEIAFDYINRSNFSTQFYEMALDLLVGTGTVIVNEEDDDDLPFSFHSVPQKYVGFEEGPSGTIETHWRKHKIKLRNADRYWPEIKLSKSLMEKMNKDYSCEETFIEGVVYDPKHKSYRGVVWAQDEDTLAWDEDYQTSSPFITGRYSKTSGEVRGRGPALMVLPDVKSLNKAKEFVLQKCAIDIAGMWTSTDDGVMNPYTITIAPGVVMPVGSNNTSNPSIQRLDTSASLELPLFEIQELQNAIKKALFNDLRDPDGPVRSATEIAMDARELAKRIGSAYGRLQTEILIPILKRVIYILVRRGKLDPIIIDGKAVDIKFTSPLARAQDMEDLLSVQQAVEFVMNTAGPENAMVSYKMEDFGSWAAEKTGMPSELVRSKAEKQEAIQAGAMAAQQEAGVQPEAPNELG